MRTRTTIACSLPTGVVDGGGITVPKAIGQLPHNGRKMLEPKSWSVLSPRCSRRTQVLWCYLGTRPRCQPCALEHSQLQAVKVIVEGHRLTPPSVTKGICVSRTRAERNPSVASIVYTCSNLSRSVRWSDLDILVCRLIWKWVL